MSKCLIIIINKIQQKLTDNWQLQREGCNLITIFYNTFKDKTLKKISLIKLK